jgi:hypothetical protein
MKPVYDFEVRHEAKKIVWVTCVLRRITIDSTRLSVAVTPFARWVYGLGLTAKVAPEPPVARPFQAGQQGATASRVNRALYGRNKVKVRTSF